MSTSLRRGQALEKMEKADFHFELINRVFETKTENLTAMAFG